VSESVWAHVVGQPDAVSRLTFSAVDPVHAYLFVGPPGSTKAEASRAFAALLMAGHDDPTDREQRSRDVWRSRRAGVVADRQALVGEGEDHFGRDRKTG